jgi:hypothetical protein
VFFAYFKEEIIMKRASLILALFLAPWVLQAEGAAPAPSSSSPAAGVTALVDKNAPKIYFPHPQFDFGKVSEGPDIVHEFQFHNRGNTVLKIGNVSTSCGCTAAVESKKEIMPGSSGTIKATYHTSGRPGAATKIITVTSNDPVNPSFQLKMQMTVEREVDVQPDRVYLYGVKKGTVRTEVVRVLGKAGKTLRILSAESLQHVVGVSFGPITVDADKRIGAGVTISLPVTQGVGVFTDSIKVKTNNPKKPDIEINVMGEVVGRVQYNPKEIVFHANPTAPVTVQLTIADPAGFAFRKVESTKGLARPFIRKSQGPDGSDLYQLEVAAVGTLPKDSDGKDEVVLYTNDDDQPKIVVPVTLQKP